MASALARTRPLDGIRRHGARAKALALHLWAKHPRELAGAVVLFAIAVLLALMSWMSRAPTPSASPPAPPPMLLRNVAPAEAVKLNAAIPITEVATNGADPFVFKGNANSRAQALQCLASAVYYEAGSESVDGQRAVAQVVLNRVRHPAFPASVCGVVYQGSTRATGCQFTFTCDGSLAQAPEATRWTEAKAVAQAALDGSVYAPIGWSTHYHANYVVPYWAASMNKDAVVGAHLFYMWRGAWGDPSIFTPRYSGHEASASALRSAALAAEAANAALAPISAASGSLAAIPGAEIKITPSMRGDKRIAVRFNQVARKAADSAKHVDYVDTFRASDTLKWSLGNGDGTSSTEAPLGKTSAPPAGSAASTPN